MEWAVAFVKLKTHLRRGILVSLCIWFIPHNQQITFVENRLNYYTSPWSVVSIYPMSAVHVLTYDWVQCNTWRHILGIISYSGYFPFICNNIAGNSVYVSQLMRYSRTCVCLSSALLCAKGCLCGDFWSWRWSMLPDNCMVSIANWVMILDLSYI